MPSRAGSTTAAAADVCPSCRRRDENHNSSNSNSGSGSNNDGYEADTDREEGPAGVVSQQRLSQAIKSRDAMAAAATSAARHDDGLSSHSGGGGSDDWQSYVSSSYGKGYMHEGDEAYGMGGPYRAIKVRTREGVFRFAWRSMLMVLLTPFATLVGTALSYPLAGAATASFTR